MQIIKTSAFAFLLCFHSLYSHSQLDTAAATKQALVYADSIVKASFYQEWKTYTALSIPSAIKYYGGKDGFYEHVVSSYFRFEPAVAEKPESIRIVTLMNDDIQQWQCVVEKTRHTRIDERNATIHSYLVGQSLDNGTSWKFIDVSHNDIKNVIYIMPEIFNTLPIPERKVAFDDDLAAQKAAPVKPKKKPKKKR
jgi:hypothetical protein